MLNSNLSDKANISELVKNFTVLNETYTPPTGWKCVEFIGKISDYNICYGKVYSDNVRGVASYADTRNFTIQWDTNNNRFVLLSMNNLEFVSIYVS